MGLAAPKNRMKLSHDPNNTRWTGNKESFGHKIMAAQGWHEGEYLGAVDANHAEHYTAANASHIRVTIKDDNLGLGAKVGSGVGAGECTGLDAFKNLLGRLNGKEEDEIEKEQKSRDDLKRAIYTEAKWGSVRFVRGGFLIGDKIQDLIEGEAERIRKLDLANSSSSGDSSSSESEAEAPVMPEKSKKKRKLDSNDAEDEGTKRKRSKKSKLESVAKHPQVVAIKEFKKSKRDKEKKQRSKATQHDDEDASDSKAVEKAEKRRRKEERRAKKAKKEKDSEEEPSKETRKKSKKDKRKALDDIQESSATDTPSNVSTPIITSGRSTPMMSGRHAVRSRNIAQKRLASMDVAALNQIFMIKTPS